ncbi:hypothetical protein F2P56_014548 [Juglans regia]|uniref:Uncharacterized protein n=1 Tax=Juglans regia TaxID=51240 RepID=A0A833XDP8_JUGRE|nr:hypothetical protein F2P56_014548 [Juglans regia]
MYTYLGGVPTPIRVKYSPLPCASPDMTELLNPAPWARLRFPTAASEVRALTLKASRWSLRWKSCSGVLLRDKESKWCNSSVVVATVESETTDSDSDSGHERECGVVESGLRTRVWYRSEVEEEMERKKKKMVRVKRAASRGLGSI